MKKSKYKKEYPRMMYLYFAGYDESHGAPSFSKFARRIGVTVYELEGFRRKKEFDAAWRECFYEPFEPFFVKEVKGYRFRCVQYGRKGLADFVCKRKHLFEEPVRSCDGDGCF